MKATLIKKIFSGDEYQYTLYLDGEVGIYAKSGIGHGWFKLSKQNCDEIFGVVDVEKLAHEFSHNLRGRSSLYAIIGFDAGFNKAMELNKDKRFTSRDMLSAYIQGTNDGTEFESLMDYDSEDFDEAHEFAKQAEREFIKSLQQPTEIEVKIEMECKIGCEHIVFNGENSLCCGDKTPKLDSDGCLILKKI